MALTYVTTSEGDTYMATRLNSAAYTGASAGEKTAALTTAELDILAVYDYPLVADVTTDQKNAIFEQGLFRLQNPDGFDARVGLQAMGVTKAGEVKEEYENAGIPICPFAVQVLQGIKKADLDAAAAFVTDYARDEDA